MQDDLKTHSNSTELPNQNIYWHKRFKYSNIYQPNNAEVRIISDLDTIPISQVKLKAKAFVIFRLNYNSKVITLSTLEWIIMYIDARLILQSKVIWGVGNDSAMKKHQLDITLDIPIMDVNETSEL